MSSPLGPTNLRRLLRRQFCPGQTSAVTHGSKLIPTGLPQGPLSFSTPTTCRSQLAGPWRALTRSCTEIHGKVPENECMHYTEAGKGCFLSLSWMCWVRLGNQTQYRQGTPEQSHKRTTRSLLPQVTVLGLLLQNKRAFSEPHDVCGRQHPCSMSQGSSQEGQLVPWTRSPPNPQPQDDGCC